MTVKELTELLAEMPQDAEVWFEYIDTEYGPMDGSVDSLCLSSAGDVVINEYKEEHQWKHRI